MNMLTNNRKRLALVYLGICQSLFSFGQDIPVDTVSGYELNPVELTASRWKELNTRSHLPVSVISVDKIQRGQQQLAFNESLNYIPGLFALNPNNFAQDLRVSIRGFGARAAFGIRGIKLVVDGIPETTPDGQAQVDNLDIGMAGRVEVIRGPSSGLYGNASGGVISVTSEKPPTDPFAELRMSWGSFGFQRYQLKTGNDNGRLKYMIHGSYTTVDGYRAHSEMENYLLNGKFDYQIDSLSTLSLILNYVDSPLSNDPGGITRAEVDEDRRQARDRNVLFDGGEALSQGKVGVLYQRAVNTSHQFQVRLYHIFRDFSNKLPFEDGGIVNLDRGFTGGGGLYQYAGTFLSIPYRLVAGIDIELQRDGRERFQNETGSQGAKVFDQNEIFQNTGIFLKQEWEFSSALRFSATLRYDNIQIEAEDQFLTDGDDSGDQNLQALSPMLGLVYTQSQAFNIYTNFSTSFETPTLSELSVNPAGAGGFNENLEPQLANNYEIGFKGIISNSFAYELALFHIQVRDELEAFPGRTFFRNAGESRRNGLELMMNYQFTRDLSAYFTYTLSDFDYSEYETPDGNLKGNQLPGIPEHMLFTELRYQKPKGWYGFVQMRYNSSIYADDANETQIDGYVFANLRTGYLHRLHKVILEPFLGINNLTDAAYPANIRINAFGGRYFEPAAGIAFFGGIRLRWGG